MSIRVVQEEMAQPVPRYDEEEEEQQNSEDQFLARRDYVHKRGMGRRGLAKKRTREEMLDDALTENIYDAIANVFDKTTWSLTKAVKRSVKELIEERLEEIKNQ